MHELALFAGAGGGILGGKLLGWKTVCAVEINEYARRVLLARQDDGCLDPFPIWDDVTTFDGRPWRGMVDIVTGGFPCQDISTAGRGNGISGERSGLWREMARIIREVGPRYALVENSPLLTLRGLDIILGEMAAMGYDAQWGVLGAEAAGAPHARKRIWILAHADRRGCEPQGQPREMGGVSDDQAGDLRSPQKSDWWSAEPAVDRVADGVADQVDRLRCLGNGQVPAVVRLAWNLLSTPENQGGRVGLPNT